MLMRSHPVVCTECPARRHPKRGDFYTSVRARATETRNLFSTYRLNNSANIGLQIFVRLTVKCTAVTQHCSMTFAGHQMASKTKRRAGAGLSCACSCGLAIRRAVALIADRGSSVTVGAPLAPDRRLHPPPPPPPPLTHHSSDRSRAEPPYSPAQLRPCRSSAPLCVRRLQVQSEVARGAP